MRIASNLSTLALRQLLGGACKAVGIHPGPTVIDSSLHGFTRILTENGWQQIQTIVSKKYQGKVAAVDATGRQVWARITQYYRGPLGG